MRNLFWGIIFVVLGILLLLDNFNVLDFGDVISNFWPLLLIIWGIRILKRRSEISKSTVGDIKTESSADLLHESNVFGSISLNIQSQNFKGGSVSTVFGDCDIDLSQATITEGEHILRIHSVFGDSLIVLPKSGAVSLSASAVLGDITGLGQRKSGFSPDLKSTSPDFDTANNRLKIIVSKVFGDVKIV